MNNYTPYLPNRTKIVDQHGANYLVRGNLPIDSNQNFTYDQINEKLKSLPETGANFDLKDHLLVVISILDNFQPDPHVNMVLKAFYLEDKVIPPAYPPTLDYGHPALGTHCLAYPGHFIWWPIQGTTKDLPKEQIVKMFIENKGYLDLGSYYFDGLVDCLHELLTISSQPTVIYYHCSLGADRTGAATFGYAVKHKGMGYNQAKAFVREIEVPAPPYVHLEDEYWEYLQG